MKTVLTISDSVEDTIFDLIRCTTTIRDLELDPLLVVPRIVHKDGTVELNDISEMLDYSLDDCDFAAMNIGYITEPEALLGIADRLEKQKKAPVICCPSLISDEGEILVGPEVYSALCDRLLHFADFLIINTIEAETFCGFDCVIPSDFMRAAKKIFNVYGCRVLIRGNERTAGKNVLFEGAKPVMIDAIPYEPGFENRYSLLTAIGCEFALGKPSELAASLALEFVSGKTQAAAAPAQEAPAAAPSSVSAEPAPDEPAKTQVPSLDNMSRLTSSLVSPGKSIRDIAREITPAAKAQDVEPAVTSSIEKPEEPKGEVTSLANSRYRFDAEVHNSITELQSLRDRLNNLNRLADSGK